MPTYCERFSLKSLLFSRPMMTPTRNVRIVIVRMRFIPLTLVTSFFAAVLTATLFSFATKVEAQNAQEAPAAAVASYEEGRSHYQAGRYEEAAESMRRALELDPGKPVLVYNLARICELQGNLDEALRYAQEYRTLVVGTEEEAEAERIIRRLEGAREYFAIRQADEAPELRSIHETTVTVTERGVADGLFWGVLGTSFAFGALAAVTGGLALRDRNRANNLQARSQNDVLRRESIRERSEHLALVSDISIGLFAIGSVTSLLLYFLRTESRTTVNRRTETASFDHFDLAAIPLRQGGAISLEVTF